MGKAWLMIFSDMTVVDIMIRVASAVVGIGVLLTPIAIIFVVMHMECRNKNEKGLCE